MLVVSDGDSDDIYEAARATEIRLGREINPSLVSAARWDEPGDDPFLTGLRRRPLVRLNIDKG